MKTGDDALERYLDKDKKYKMNPNFLDFEQPIAELEAKIEELRYVGNDTELNLSEEIATLQDKSKSLTESIFKDLTTQPFNNVTQ